LLGGIRGLEERELMDNMERMKKREKKFVNI